MDASRYFFITGTGRSGTTLLQSMISRAQGVFIPEETHFMSLLWQHRRKMSSLQSDRGWQAAKKAIEKRCATAGIAFVPDRFETLTESAPRHYATLLSAWLRMAAEAAAGSDGPVPTVIGEKSPTHTGFVLELLAMMPNSAVVHIVRDPRDVAVSQHEAWNAAAMSAAVRWRLDQKRQADYEALVHPSRFATVRYEDLVTDPEPQLRRVCGVLGVEFSDPMLKPHEREHRGFTDHEPHKHRTLEPVTSQRIGRYRGTLSRRAISAIEHTCGEHMDRLGYKRDCGLNTIGPLAAAWLAAPMVWRKVATRTPAARIAKQVRSRPEAKPGSVNAAAE